MHWPPTTVLFDALAIFRVLKFLFVFSYVSQPTLPRHKKPILRGILRWHMCVLSLATIYWKLISALTLHRAAKLINFSREFYNEVRQQ